MVAKLAVSTFKDLWGTPGTEVFRGGGDFKWGELREEVVEDVKVPRAQINLLIKQIGNFSQALCHIFKKWHDLKYIWHGVIQQFTCAQFCSWPLQCLPLWLCAFWICYQAFAALQQLAKCPKAEFRFEPILASLSGFLWTSEEVSFWSQSPPWSLLKGRQIQ